MRPLNDDFDDVSVLSTSASQFLNMDSLLHKIADSYPNLRFLSLLGNPGYPDQLSCDADASQYTRHRSATG